MSDQADSIVVVPTLALYPFKFFDIVSRHWHCARYVATVEQMTERHTAVQIIGAPELREVEDASGTGVGLFPPQGVQGAGETLDGGDIAYERTYRESE